MSDKDTIRDMVMALSRGDHAAAEIAASEVMAAKTTRLTEVKVDDDGDDDTIVDDASTEE
jgi:hypothetical protein